MKNYRNRTHNRKLRRKDPDIRTIQNGKPLDYWSAGLSADARRKSKAFYF